MIDRDTALGHHLFKITQTERVGDVPPHAQQHQIERIVEALQDPGDARSKRLSRCLRFLHRAAKVYLSVTNTTSPALARQNLESMAMRWARCSRYAFAALSQSRKPNSSRTV